MKKYLFALAFAGLTSAAMAQSFDTPTQKYSVATNNFWSNWYLQGSFAYNTFSVGGEDWNLYKGDYSKPGFGVALGKWFTPGFGARMKYQGLKRKIAGKEFDANMFRIDMMFSLRNLLLGYKESRIWDWSIFTGAGGMQRESVVWDLGTNMNWHLTRRLGVFAEASIIMGDKSRCAFYDFYDGWGSRMISAEVGLTFNIGKVGWSKTPDVDAIMALNRSQIDALNAQIADAESENARLKSLLAKKPEPETVTNTVKELITTTASVFFNIGRSNIASKKDLVNVSEIVELAKANGSTIVVTGYADSKTGNAAYNQTLSEKRAQTVADALVEMGMSRDNIQIVAKGGVDSLNPYSYNRRATVEIK